MIFKKDGELYRLNPYGCLLNAVINASDYSSKLEEINDEQEYLRQYVKILYKIFEDYMLDNNYRIINIEDFKNSGIFE